MYLIETTHGDVRLADAISYQLQYYYLDDVRTISLIDAPLERLDVVSPGKPWVPREHAKLFLNDGGQICLDTSRLVLRVANDAGEWDLPVGAVTKLKTFCSEETLGNKLIVQFPSRTTATFLLVSRYPVLRIRDSFGNKFKVLIDDMLEIASRIGIANRPLTNDVPTHSSTGSEDLVKAISQDGREQYFRTPPFVWTIEGVLGRILLPTPSSLAVILYPKGPPQTTTIYGETFCGRLAPHELLVPASGTRSEPLRLLLKKQQTIEFTGAQRYLIPNGWLVWRLTTGDRFAARLATETLSISVASSRQVTEVPTDSIAAILREGSALCIVDKNENTVVGTPPAEAAEVVLLVNGMACRVPWKLVQSVGSGQLAVEGTDNLSAGYRGNNQAGSVSQKFPRSKGLPVLDEMVLLPGGTFSMGRTNGPGLQDELPPHRVTLNPFYIDPTEVTKAQFAEFIDDTNYKTDAERAGSPATWRNPGFSQRPDEPVVCVSWYDAARYCNWRSKQARLKPCYEFSRHNEEVKCYPERGGYRLPTEAEWEYAARQCGQDILYPWGNETNLSVIIRLANFRQPHDGPQDRWAWTNPVRAFPANSYGLYGLGGNVWEWCDDWYYVNAYSSIHQQRPTDPCVRNGDVAGLTRKVMRGGSFDSDIDLLRCASRANGTPLASANRVGFRCVRSAGEPLSSP